MDLKIGDIIINGFIVEIYENVKKEGVRHPKGHWMGEKIYIYDGLSDSGEEEIQKVLEYLYSEGFTQDRRTDYTVVSAEDYE